MIKRINQFKYLFLWNDVSRIDMTASDECVVIILEQRNYYNLYLSQIWGFYLSSLSYLRFHVFLSFLFSFTLTFFHFLLLTESVFNFLFSKFTCSLIIINMIINSFRMNLRIFSSFPFLLISSILEYMMVIHFE